MNKGSEGSPPQGKADAIKELRTFLGIRLPEGSKVKRFHEDTRTNKEHGEKTWTTAQTVRDLFQNHLDANTDLFFNKLVSRVIDTNKLSEKPAKPGDDFDEFTYTLFRFRKALRSFSPEAEHEMLDLLNNHAGSVPVKPEFLDEQGKLKLEPLKRAIDQIAEIPPWVSFKVIDSKAADEQPDGQWLTYDDLKQKQFSETTEASSADSVDYRYRIVEMKIEDEGSGFDAKLSAFYKTTKRDKRHLRGKFGEGAKMSVAHLMRHGAKVEMRSTFDINGGEQSHSRTWLHKSYVAKDEKVKQTGIQIDLPPGQEAKAGSYTLIKIGNADLTFQQEFRENVDPRMENGGLARNCLDYSPVRYIYPMSYLGIEGKSVGISLEGFADDQYVQGLKVGSGIKNIHDIRPLFSYDFLDATILQGRDRNILNRKMMEDQVRDFWIHADSQDLVSSLIEAVGNGTYDKNITPEANVLNEILYKKYFHTTNEREIQAKRTTEYALKVFPAIVKAKTDTKNVIVHTQDAYSNISLINILESKGYNIILFRAYIGRESISSLNQTHQGNYEFCSLEQTRKELQSTASEVDHGDERIQLSQELFQSAFTELGVLAEKAGLKKEDFNLETSPKFHHLIDPEGKLPFGLNFNEDTKKFELVIQQELLAEAIQAKGAREYWKNRMLVELLATYNRREKFPDQHSIRYASQGIAQSLLTGSLHRGMPHIDVLPEDFQYVPQIKDPIEELTRFSAEETKIRDALEGWKIYNDISRFHISMDQMELVISKFAGLPEAYKREVKGIIGNRIIVEDGVVGYCEFQEDRKGEPVYIRKRLDSLSPEGKINDKPVYRLGDKIFIYDELPKGSVIKAGFLNPHTFVMLDDQLLDFAENSFGPYQFNSYPLIVEPGGFAHKIYKNDVKRAMDILEDGLKKVKIDPLESKSEKGMEFLTGIVETPLPPDYGIDEWDNPVRVFQDIVQNHLDASPDGKVDMHFEVQRGQQRLWITDKEMTDSDVIVGFSVSDDGDGYTPNDLGTMGKSSKKSPLFAGKYGEGQKMLAAAAVRNGFELEFSSLAGFENKRYRWRGAVGTKPIEIVIDGKPTNDNRVVFNVTSNQAEEREEYVSSTVIRLPEGAGQNSQVWQEWMKIIDPRIKDKFGDGGLARYVLPMKKKKDENIIDMGYMKILMDRPGEVYENGLLVSRNESIAFGYDVPEIVTTRERNYIDHYKLKQYFTNAIYSCPDPGYSMELVRRLKEKYLFSLVNNPQGTVIKELDLDFGRMNPVYSHNFVPSKPLLRKAYDDQMATYLVHSEKALKTKIKWLTDTLSTPNFVSPDYITKIKKDIRQAFTSIVSAGHIPSDHIIHLDSGTQYANWSRLLPTIEDYAASIAVREVPVAEDIHNALAAVVSASSSMVGGAEHNLRSTPEGQRVFETIIAGKKTKKPDASTLAETEKAIAEQDKYWTLEAL